jgi:flagellar P-ring protein FlgI
MKLLFLLSFIYNLNAAVRVKDLANVRGVRENQLIGYGLVVGLNGTGDSTDDLTVKALDDLLKNLCVEKTDAKLSSKNAAVVIVTAKLPAFSKSGNKIDVLVSSLGDSKSLEGGTLLKTNLIAPNKQVYAIAQGPLSVGSSGQDAGGGFGGGTSSQSHKTVANIPNGAIIEREIEYKFNSISSFILSLHNPDFTTASRLVRIVNQDLGGKYAIAEDPGTVKIYTPYGFEDGNVEFLARIESLEINPDNKAKIIVNERTGTVIMGGTVKILPVIISHGNLTVKISTSENNLTNNNRTENADASVIILDGGASIGSLANALNAIGAKPKDLITVFQSIKKAGALQAELVIM